MSDWSSDVCSSDLQPLAVLAVGCDHEVLQHGQTVELVGDLEGAHQAAGEALVRRQQRDVLAEELDAPVIGPQRTGAEVEQRGLAGAVGAEQAGDAAFRHREAAMVDCPKTAKVFRQPGQYEHLILQGCFLLLCSYYSGLMAARQIIEL